jgi:hypothetical protein
MEQDQQVQKVLRSGRSPDVNLFQNTTLKCKQAEFRVDVKSRIIQRGYTRG